MFNLRNSDDEGKNWNSCHAKKIRFFYCSANFFRYFLYACLENLHFQWNPDNFVFPTQIRDIRGSRNWTSIWSIQHWLWMSKFCDKFDIAPYLLKALVLTFDWRFTNIILSAIGMMLLTLALFQIKMTTNCPLCNVLPGTMQPSASTETMAVMNQRDQPIFAETRKRLAETCCDVVWAVVITIQKKI